MSGLKCLSHLISGLETKFSKSDSYRDFFVLLSSSCHIRIVFSEVFQMNFTFIINPHSGTRKNKLHLAKLIEQKASSDFEIKYTEYAGHASELAAKAVEDGCENIVAAGGDGTMNEVAGKIVGSNLNFGLIPMGSGNGFARSLGLPLNPEKALDVIFRTKIKRIDTGKINGLSFFALAGIGFDAQVASQFQKSVIRGALPYFFISFKEFLKYSYPRYFINSPEKKFKINPLVITIANAAQFGNGAQIAPQADIQDGWLDVCILDKMSVFEAMKILPKMFTGKINQADPYSSYRSQTIEIESDLKDFIFHTDGEPHLAEKKVSIKIIPRSLNVITV